MNSLYGVIGVSKQAVAQQKERQDRFDVQVTILMMEVEDLRSEHPGCGLEKMYYSLNPSFIGRDNFIELFTQLGYKLNKKINYRRTTYSKASDYPNLIQGMVIKSPSIVWQTDITYYEVNGRFYYIIFIIDVYTKIIVGYQVSDNMRASANFKALEMAFANYPSPRIHHSDHGSQYLSTAYTTFLREKGCEISMADKAQDNAYAERINGTIKNEYLRHWTQKTFNDLEKQVAKAVNNYNNKRLHNNLKRQKPAEFNKTWIQTKGEGATEMTVFNSKI